MIAIVDYEVGNLRSVQKAFEHVGCQAEVTADPAVVAKSAAIVLPGVGAFGAAAHALRRSGLLPVVVESVRRGKPFLGICVGMQLLFDYSEELYAGVMPQGLGLIKGAVRRFPAGLKTPQIGWNQLRIRKACPLYAGVPDESHVYFVHSYYCAPDDAGIAATVTDYGVEFCSSIAQNNIMAIQFHPEKSGKVGLRILSNFAAWAQSMAER